MAEYLFKPCMFSLFQNAYSILTLSSSSALTETVDFNSFALMSLLSSSSSFLSVFSTTWLVTKLKYSFFISINWSCVPCSTTTPLDKTMILSAFLIVESLCATMTVVLSLLAYKLILYRKKWNLDGYLLTESNAA